MIRPALAPAAAARWRCANWRSLQDVGVYDALLGLHARACRTALEVYHLLTDGLPKGALARARTLHEIAVTAMVIADYGRRSEHRDLADRFLDHEAVATYKDALNYQLNCETLGYEPFSDEEMAEMKAGRDAVVAKYGSAYKEQYGWAAGLDKPTAPTFGDLEKLAKLSHLRSHYSWASHEVHSDAKGSFLNESIWGETIYRETSYSDDGLADPGHMALGYTMSTFAAGSIVGSILYGVLAAKSRRLVYVLGLLLQVVGMAGFATGCRGRLRDR